MLLRMLNLSNVSLYQHEELLAAAALLDSGITHTGTSTTSPTASLTRLAANMLTFIVLLQASAVPFLQN